jgi:hypothetical protein
MTLSLCYILHYVGYTLYLTLSLTLQNRCTSVWTHQDSDYEEYDVRDLNDGYNITDADNSYNNNRYKSNGNYISEGSKLLALKRGRCDPQSVSTYTSNSFLLFKYALKCFALRVDITILVHVGVSGRLCSVLSILRLCLSVHSL